MKQWATPTGNYSQSVKVKEFSDDLSIELVNLDGGGDCRVGHFGYNFYYRTAGACKVRWTGYKSIAVLKREVKKLLKKNGLTFEKFDF
jgi:hypothetical protein